MTAVNHLAAEFFAAIVATAVTTLIAAWSADL
jgi:hypothetical protein